MPTRASYSNLFGSGYAGLGYLGLSFAPTLWLACLAVIIAHSGGATVWVFSTTLIQTHTEDNYRGRVFSAEFAFSMLTLSIVTYTAGGLSDKGVDVRTLALYTSALILIPAILWASAQRLWQFHAQS